MSSFSGSRKLPVDSHRADWPRLVAENVNSLLRAYIFAFHVIEKPTASEILLLHPCGADFTIPPNWGERTENAKTVYAGVIPSIDVNPTASLVLTVARKPKDSAVYTTCGTWTISTGGVFTATTVAAKQIDFAQGDAMRVTAPSVADATAAQMAFTIIGAR